MNSKKKQKIVLLLTIDCLRYDHLRASNYYRNTSPYQEKFIKNGAFFSNAIANGPETASSFSSIFTSTLPYLNGGFSPIPSQKITFPQLLNENKILCYGIHSNPNLGHFFNYHKGFRVFIDGLNSNLKNKSNKERKESKENSTNKSSFIKIIIKIFWKKVFDEILSKISNKIIIVEKLRNRLLDINIIRDKITEINRKGFTASIIVKNIKNFIKTNKLSNSLFIWGHFMDAHWPYNPPSKNLLNFTKRDIRTQERSFLLNKLFWNHNVPEIYRKKKPDTKLTKVNLNKLINLYDGEINFVDESLERIFSFLKSKYRENCLIIITSDHGEAFHEHEYLNHGGQVFDELLRVPLFIVELGKIFKVKKVEDLVQLLDIGPTVLDYFGIDPPDFFQGKSLLPLINGKLINREDFVISESFKKRGRFRRNNKLGDKIFSIRKKNWKYIFDGELKKEYLFNLNKDPFEKVNLIEKKPEILNEFLKIKSEHFEKIEITSEIAKITSAIKTIDINKFNI